MNCKQRRTEAKKSGPGHSRHLPPSGCWLLPSNSFKLGAGRSRAALPAGSGGHSRHADSLHLLGVIAYQTGRHDLALDMIRKAIAINLRLPRFSGRLVGLWVTSWSWWPACRLRRLSASGIPGPNAVARGYTNPRCS